MVVQPRPACSIVFFLVMFRRLSVSTHERNLAVELESK